jgi:hypothetical protein
MMRNRCLSITKVAGKEFRKLAVFIPAPFRERPTINLYYHYHVVKSFDLIKSGFTTNLTNSSKCRQD